MKRLIAMLLTFAMLMSFMSMSAFAAENELPTSVAEIVETGIQYKSLSAAIAAANESVGADTIKMLTDIDFDAAEALTINGDITITGAHTISRGSYTGTLFTVPAGATLTLDGGLIIDGNNNWIFNEEAYRADMKINNSKHPYATAEEGAPVASGAVISISGDLVLNKATIRNHYSTVWNFSVFFVADGATLTMNDGATVTHNYKNSSSLIADVQPGGTWTINDGSSIDNNYGQGNGSLSYMKGTMIMNGGKICSNYGNGSGLIMIYSASDESAKFATFTMNGGSFCHNANFGGGWDSMIYVHYSDRRGYDRGGTFTMNGGTLKGNESYIASTIVGNAWSSHIFLNGGIINETISHGNYYTTFGYEMTFGKNLTISDETIRIKANSIIDGIVNSNIQLTSTGISKGQNGLWTESGTGMSVVGNGIVNGNTNVSNGALATIDGATWNGYIIVNAVGVDTTPLTTTQNAIINGDVIVYVSVPSGEYTNATESADRQALAYVDNGAIFGVESDVLYYHRLTSAQKKNIVVTFDYNGGLDPQGWSGSQLTSDEAFAPACPAPTKKGHVLIGWKYAVDSNSNSLNMDGTTDYAGEAITENIRLIAQWETEDRHVIVNYVDNKGNVLANQDVYTLTEGGEYNISAKPIAGYLQSSHTGSTSGVMGEEDVVVTFVYTKIYNLTVNYVDADGNVLSEQIVSPREEGARYDTEAKQFGNYTLSAIPENASGIMEGDVVVTYVYIKDHLMTVIHIAGENEHRESYYVPHGAEYTTSAATIEGYSQYSVSGDAANGIMDGDKTITYTYTLDEEELEDPSTPMGPDEEIEDEDVPLASAPANPNEAPKTGDDSGVFMSMIVGTMALVAMAVLVLNKKKYVLG